MMRMAGALIWYALLLLIARPTYADVYKYVDQNGQDIYVNDLDRVPEKYKDGVETIISENSAAPKTASNQPRAKTPKPAGPSVEVFVTSWCPVCRKLENFLPAKRISYQRYD